MSGEGPGCPWDGSRVGGWVGTRHSLAMKAGLTRVVVVQGWGGRAREGEQGEFWGWCRAERREDLGEGHHPRPGHRPEGQVPRAVGWARSGWD